MNSNKQLSEPERIGIGQLHPSMRPLCTHPSIQPLVQSYIDPSVYLLSINQSIHHSLRQSLYPSILRLCICSSIHPLVHLHIDPSVGPSIIHPSLGPSIRPCIPSSVHDHPQLHSPWISTLSDFPFQVHPVRRRCVCIRVGPRVRVSVCACARVCVIYLLNVRKMDGVDPSKVW